MFYNLKKKLKNIRIDFTKQDGWFLVLAFFENTKKRWQVQK